MKAHGSEKRKKAPAFTAEERAAMKARIKELEAEAGKANGESDVLASIAAMPEPSKSMGERLHTIIAANGPSLVPRTWYGMPAYAKDGKVLCFFRGAEKFKERYLTFGFQDNANLDDGAMWPVAFALSELTPAAEEQIAALVKKAVG